MKSNKKEVSSVRYITDTPSASLHPFNSLTTDLDAYMKLDRKRVKELLFFDLMADYHHCNGVYLFFTKDEKEHVVKYVGKTTSRAVVDRMGSHLDLRESGFLNCLVKRIAKIDILKKDKKEKVDPCLLNWALMQQETQSKVGELYFLFIPVYNPLCSSSDKYKHSVGVLESSLIKHYTPKYNY